MALECASTSESVSRFSRIRSLWWIIPLVLFCCYLPFSSLIDLKIAQFFSVGGKFKAPKWTWVVYTYGIIPGQLLFIGSLVTSLFLYCKKSRTPLFFSSLYICLTLIVGGGLVSHALFKQFWQRPRPKQTTLFGAKYPYCPVWKSYQGKKDRHLRSLPSGHASMGFYFFSLYFLGRRLRKKYLALFGMGAACLMGVLLSYARFAQGGHFFSDSVLSLFIMWQTCYILDRLLEDSIVQRKTDS